MLNPLRYWNSLESWVAYQGPESTMCPTGLQALQSHAPQFIQIHNTIERCNAPVSRIEYTLLGNVRKDNRKIRVLGRNRTYDLLDNGRMIHQLKARLLAQGF